MPLLLLLMLPLCYTSRRICRHENLQVRDTLRKSRIVCGLLCCQKLRIRQIRLQLLDFLVPQYINEGKAQLVISVGCTGGQHRSVFIANKLYEYLREKGYSVDVTHRDIPHRK